MAPRQLFPHDYEHRPKARKIRNPRIPVDLSRFVIPSGLIARNLLCLRFVIPSGLIARNLLCPETTRSSLLEFLVNRQTAFSGNAYSTKPGVPDSPNQFRKLPLALLPAHLL
jgi:hypothetical protein